MSTADVSIPREAVDKAARALAGKLVWERLSPTAQFNYREKAMGALNAAASLIVAPHMDRFAVELKQRAEARDAVDADDPDLEECEHGGDCHTDAAVSTWLRAAWWAERNANELRAQS